MLALFTKWNFIKWREIYATFSNKYVKDSQNNYSSENNMQS